MAVFYEAAGGRITAVHATGGAGRTESPDNQVEPGWYLWSDSSVKPGPEISSATIQLRNAYGLLHRGFTNLTLLLNDVQQYEDPDHVLAARRIIRRLHQGAYYQNKYASLTAQQQLAWIAASALGTTDVPASDPLKFFDVAETLTGGELTPAGPISLVDQDDNSSRTLAAAIAAPLTREAGRMATSTQLEHGRWTAKITA